MSGYFKTKGFYYFSVKTKSNSSKNFVILLFKILTSICIDSAKFLLY